MNALERELQREAQMGILSGPQPKQPKQMAQVPSALTTHIDGAGLPKPPAPPTGQRPPTSTTMPVGDPTTPIFGATPSAPSAASATSPTGPTTPAPVTPTAPTAPTAPAATPPAASTVPLVQGPPPPGWDAGNWNNPNMRTVKYDAGRLLYGARRPSDVARIVASPAFQARFPGATFDGKDRINFNGAPSEGNHGSPVHWVDVLQSADRDADTANGIWWGPLDGASGASGGASAVGTSPSMGMAANNSSLGRILSEINAASNGEMSPAEREALLQILQGA